MNAEVIREWYKNGNIKKQYKILRGHIHGSFQSFYINGKPKSDLNYHLGKLDGSQRYFHKNGKLSKEIDYVQGKKTGECKKYGVDFAIECEYLNNKLHGRKITVNATNVVDAFYVNGKLSGPWSNGSTITGIYEKGYYFKNKKQGIWEVLKLSSSKKPSKERTPVQTLSYINGILNGKCIEYVGGKIRATCMYKDGLRHGEFVLYYGDGKIEVKATYRKNKAVVWHKNHPDGVLKPSEP